MSLVPACVAIMLLNIVVMSEPAPSWPSEQELRRWAVKLYKEQPLHPQTSMDKDFKHQMPDLPGDQPGSNAATSPSTKATPLPFLAVWNVLDMAAKGSGLKPTVESEKTSLAEGALLDAVAKQSKNDSPTVCLSGFGTGHSSIVWLESTTTGRVIAIDPFSEQHQRGSNAFLTSLYPGRFVALPGDISTVLQQIQASGLPLACDVVHIDLQNKDINSSQSTVAKIAALEPFLAGLHGLILTGVDRNSLVQTVWREAQAKGLVGAGACQALEHTRRVCAGSFRRG